jgi:hypothetical protein
MINLLPFFRRVDWQSLAHSRLVRAAYSLSEGALILRHELWNGISTNPGLAGAVLLVVFIGAVLWAWWPAGFLLP